MTDINKSVSGLNFSSPYDVETPCGTPNPPNHGIVDLIFRCQICAHWNPLIVKVLINLINNPKKFNVEIDDLGAKPCIPYKSLLQWSYCKCLAW